MAATEEQLIKMFNEAGTLRYFASRSDEAFLAGMQCGLKAAYLGFFSISFQEDVEKMKKGNRVKENIFRHAVDENYEWSKSQLETIAANKGDDREHVEHRW